MGLRTETITAQEFIDRNLAAEVAAGRVVVVEKLSALKEPIVSIVAVEGHAPYGYRVTTQKGSFLAGWSMDYLATYTNELASPSATDTSFAAWLALNPPPDVLELENFSADTIAYLKRGMDAMYALWVLDEARKTVRAQVVEHDGSDIPF